MSDEVQIKTLNNILDTDLDWQGKDVYVIGSGPNAAPYMVEEGGLVSSIPTKIVAACNKGVYSQILPAVWLCATPALAQLDWFNKWMRFYASSNEVLPKPLIVGRFGEWLKNYPAFTHYFNPNGSLWSHVKRDPKTNRMIDVYKGFGCVDGYLRGGASAVARGAQLAWFNKAKRCILIGADMTGMKYFDGTINKWKPSSLDTEGNWIELDYFNALIEWFREHGMDVVSLTDTKLNVEVIDAP